MNEIKDYSESIFESIKHIDEFGVEYWEARELQKALEYKEWRNFKKTVDKSMLTCINSKQNVLEHFVEFNKVLEVGNKAKMNLIDYKLSRYACYLIVQNGDSKKEVIALGQTYFAVQTRKMELTELEYEKLSEDQKRLYRRKQASDGNYSLNRTAVKSGVKNLAEFHNAGYKGLYNGETANDIFKRKKLGYREDILDDMSSEELGANIFRITQTEAKLKRDKVDNEYTANSVHYEIGKKVRNAIIDMGGTMPEDLPTQSKSLKHLDKEKNEIT